MFSEHAMNCTCLVLPSRCRISFAGRCIDGQLVGSKWRRLLSVDKVEELQKQGCLNVCTRMQFSPLNSCDVWSKCACCLKTKGKFVVNKMMSIYYESTQASSGQHRQVASVGVAHC